MARKPPLENRSIDPGDQPAEWIDPKKLLPWAKNPRKNTEAIGKVMESIREFGFGRPVVARKANLMIIGGHTATAAAIRLGLERVPVRLLDIDQQKAELLALADNRLGEIATWDKDLLSEVMTELGNTGVDAELFKVAGWDENMVDLLTERTSIAPDEAPVPPKNPVTKAGDVWLLGPHRLLCGSCGELSRLVKPGECKLLVTDPPYGVDYQGKMQGYNGWDHHKKTPLAIRGDTQLEVLQEWSRWFEDLAPLLAEGAAFYVCVPSMPSVLPRLIDGLREAGMPPRLVVVWVKSMFVLSARDYHSRHELLLFGWVGKKHRKLEDRTQDDVWEIPSCKSDVHPTMKPVELYARCMRNHSKLGDLVCDAFAGSGTVFVTAHQENRICVGSEISPAYCDVIVERFEAFSGIKAIKRVV